MALSSTLRPARGFHFEYSTTLSVDKSKQECVVYLLFVLPASVFVDKYELKQRAVTFTLHGHGDLELPLAAVDGSPSILEIRVPQTNSAEVTIQFPVHARYPHPSASPYSAVRLPGPQALWACPLIGASPAQDDAFSHIPAPYSPSFDLNAWNVRFLNTPQQYHEVEVPAGASAHAQFVEFGTVFAVLAAFFYVARAMWKAGTRLRETPRYYKNQ